MFRDLLVRVFIVSLGLAIGSSTAWCQGDKYHFSTLDYLFLEDDIFAGQMVYIKGFDADAFKGTNLKTGLIVKSTMIDDPDYYSASFGFGREIRSIYKKMNFIRSEKFIELPDLFDPVVDIVYEYISKYGITNQPFSNYYVGPRGIMNGPGFTFAKKDLPTKIVRASFCFGVDPFIVTGMIHQESQFAIKSVSGGKAVGLLQITSAGFMGFNEQMGILDDEPKAYHGKRAPEIFKGYIDCYLGPKKRWVNIWDDPKAGFPKGRAAYVDGYIGVGRVSLHQRQHKDWLLADHDRLMIYGVGLFKLYLGKFKKYPEALARYNHSDTEIHLEKVFQNYGKMHSLYESDIRKQNNPFNVTPPKNHLPQSTLYAFHHKQKKCLIPIAVLERHLNASAFLQYFISAEERIESVYDLLFHQGDCRSDISF